jgi:glutamate formiminotransferase/formiminotetrahydrofolate cyclodeaminase
MEVMLAMTKKGIQNSLSDAGVGALCARTAVYGAYFNVRINAKDIKDRDFADDITKRAKKVFDKTIKIENEIIEFINSKI